MIETLDDVSPGQQFRIAGVDDSGLRARLLRLGFMDGPVTVRNRLRRGPVVVSRNGTDLALGASVAERIEVDEVREA
ncbi:MAG: ferrous iron transport protein A [Halodesulfurarchaeum sp.]